MLAEKEALLVARLEEFGGSELLTPEFGLNSDQEAGSASQPSPFESTLVARLRLGEMEAFDQLVEEYQALVYALALRILNNAEDARDATQETFLKVYRHLDKLRCEASVKIWNGCIESNTDRR